MNYRDRISQIIENKRDFLIDVSDDIWSFAEIGYKEWKSAERLCEALEQEGFNVQRSVGEIETAFIASYGSGTPIVAILGEYDALSGLSQKGGIAKPVPITNGGNGHGCGHNLLGTGSLAAAIAVRYYMEENNLPGTVRYYGCPAEESGAGKTHMVREGLFDDVDFALTWHPGSHNKVMSSRSLACTGGSFRFIGKSSHAAASPHLGRSALDAVELMNVGANYLREHIIQDARIHYAITNTGGISPNVVQAEAEVFYYTRAPRFSQAAEIYERVCDIARGAALMTGTQVEIPVAGGLSDLIPNTVLETVMHKNFAEIGTPIYDEDEIQFAREIRSTLANEDKEHDIQFTKELKGKELSDVVEPYVESSEIMPGSTDVGDVSWIVPTAQCNTSCFVLGTPLHTWQVVTQGATSIAHKGMLHAGKVIAATAVDVMQNQNMIEQAKEELYKRKDGEMYISPLPEGLTLHKVKQYQ